MVDKRFDLTLHNIDLELSGEQSEAEVPVSQAIREELQRLGRPFFANDNISDVLKPHHKKALIQEVEARVEDLLRSLVIDIDNDHNTRETAHRVAKMFVNEVFRGRYDPAPHVTTFPNAKKLDELYTTGPITIRSACSHHLVPIVGKCWIGVIPRDRLFGLSKFNRVVEWFAARPQIQEELAVQIADYLENMLQPVGLAVVIEATHMCMTWRGVREEMSATMKTSVMRGKMLSVPAARSEFFELIRERG